MKVQNVVIPIYDISEVKSNAALLFSWYERGGSIFHNGHKLDPCILSLLMGLAFNITLIPAKCLLIMTLSTLSAVPFPPNCITALRLFMNMQRLLLNAPEVL